MSNVTPISKRARDLSDIAAFLDEPFDSDEDFRNPIAFMRRFSDEVLSSLKAALPGAKDIPQPDELGLVELARLAGLTPEQVADFVETAVPTKAAKVSRMPPSEAEMGTRAYFCDRLDDEGKRIGLLVAIPFGVSQWRLFDLPLTLFREALDSVHATPKTWAQFVQSIDEHLVGVVPDERTAQSALQEASAPSSQIYENIVSAAAVNFKLAARALVNSACLFRLASIQRGRGLRHTISALTRIRNEGGNLGRVGQSGISTAGIPGTDPGTLRHFDPAD